MGDDALPTCLLYPFPICCDSWLLRIMAMPFCLRELPLSGGNYLIKEVTLPSPSHPDPRWSLDHKGVPKACLFFFKVRQLHGAIHTVELLVGSGWGWTWVEPVSLPATPSPQSVSLTTLFHLTSPQSHWRKNSYLKLCFLRTWAKAISI